jgi:HEAT repeat protein
VEAIPALVEALADQTAAGNCSQALGKVGPAAVPALVQALDDRRLVYWALGTIARIPSAEARSALPRVLSYLKDSDPQIRWSAVAAAVTFVKDNGVERESVVPAVIEALQLDADEDVRGQSAAALGEIGGRQAVTALKRAATKDKDKSVRNDAKEALAKLSAGSRSAAE